MISQVGNQSSNAHVFKARSCVKVWNFEKAEHMSCYLKCSTAAKSNLSLLPTNSFCIAFDHIFRNRPFLSVLIGIKYFSKTLKLFEKAFFSVELSWRWFSFRNQLACKPAPLLSAGGGGRNVTKRTKTLRIHALADLFVFAHVVQSTRAFFFLCKRQIKNFNL